MLLLIREVFFVVHECSRDPLKKLRLEATIKMLEKSLTRKSEYSVVGYQAFLNILSRLSNSACLPSNSYTAFVYYLRLLSLWEM
jgi:hypothetical protein